MSTATTQHSLLDNLLKLNAELASQEKKLKEGEAFAERVLAYAEVPEEDMIDTEIEEVEKVLDTELGSLIQESIADEEADEV